MGKNNSSRILIYSHDTFGLGHLRRCRTIAHHLVEQNKQLTVLILSGSPIIGSFDFSHPRGFRARAGRDQAEKWRIHVAQPAHGYRRPR